MTMPTPSEHPSTPRPGRGEVEPTLYRRSVTRALVNYTALAPLAREVTCLSVTARIPPTICRARRLLNDPNYIRLEIAPARPDETQSGDQADQSFRDGVHFDDIRR